MTAAIAYDRPVVNLIDELSETGHVTHIKYKKKSVTFHHNGGRLSIQGCLDVWTIRPASAHFQSDRVGAIGQYVQVNEYAWAVGNKLGNQETISIEMANETLAPEWKVGDATWKSAARLAGWLFVHVIKEAPTSTNVFFHHKWSATACAGPYMDKIYAQLLAEVQKSYNEFKGNTSGGSAPHPTPTPKPKPKSTDEVAREVIDGRWGNDPQRTQKLTAAGYDAAAVQRRVNEILSGGAPKPAPKPKPNARKTVSQIANEVIDGKWGNDPERSQKLSKAGYNAAAVQNEVNRKLSGKSSNAASKKSIGQLADEVMLGKWGNDPERTRRLRASGYDAAAVQREVNRRL